MKVAFLLSMPNRGSWNGGWSGAGKVHAIIKDFPPKKRPAEGSHYYSFGDGWGASVQVKHIDGIESRTLRKINAGFCGYDWMVDSILWYGQILNDAQKKERREKLKAEAVKP